MKKQVLLFALSSLFISTHSFGMDELPKRLEAIATKERWEDVEDPLKDLSPDGTLETIQVVYLIDPDNAESSVQLELAKSYRIGDKVYRYQRRHVTALGRLPVLDSGEESLGVEQTKSGLLIQFIWQELLQNIVSVGNVAQFLDIEKGS